jgi:hypothetical protein
MSAPVHLYLDIDGVLNAHDALLLPAADRSWPDYRVHNKYEVISPAMVEALNEVIATHDLKVFWLTTWEREAPAWGESIGLAGAAAWEWLPTHYRDDAPGTWGKHRAIQEHMAATQPAYAFWIDDDLAQEAAARDWAQQAMVYTLFPYAARGITPDMLRTMSDILTHDQPKDTHE